MEGFKELVPNWCPEFEVQHCPDFILSNKLKLLKNKLKEWSKSNFGELVNKKNSLLNELAELVKLKWKRPQ